MSETGRPGEIRAGAAALARVEIAPGLEVPRILVGLWQVADLERGGAELDREAASDALIAYADAGFDGFDMADHYGSAELIAGRAREKLAARDGAVRARFFTKWCPDPSQWRPAEVRAGVRARLERLGVERIDLLQLHWWTFEHPGWIDVLDTLSEMVEEGVVGALGVTNFDADHLHVALREKFPVVSNQVSFSVVDRRAAGDLSAVCREGGVKLLAYGTLLGGFLGERWLDAPDPAEIPDWSKRKYRRFIAQAGGWDAFQGLLRALKGVAARHGVSIANVAMRWVLEHDAVACVILGARLTEREHRADAARVFSFALDDADRAALAEAFAAMRPIPGDCGDEYRRPPYLTASGDLSHHLDALPSVFAAEEFAPGRLRAASGSVWERVCGFSRAVRAGDRVLVSGTTATHGADRAICIGDVRGQTVYALDKIAAALRALGAGPEDVVRTRVLLRDAGDWEAAARVHGRVFAAARPANTLIGGAELVGPYEVEIEAEAVAPADRPPGDRAEIAVAPRGETG